MSRRALLWLAGLALVVGALLITDALLWTPGLTEVNVRRLRPGMTLTEVEALLGGSAEQTWVRRGVAGQRARRVARTSGLAWYIPKVAPAL